MGAARAEHAHASLYVGVGLVLLPHHGEVVVMGGDIGIQILVAGKDGDVDIVDKEKGVGIIFQSSLDDGEESLLTDGPSKGGVAIGIHHRRAGDVDTEGVAILSIVEGDDGLIESSARDGVPFKCATAAHSEAEFIGSPQTGVEEDFLNGVASLDSGFVKTHQGCIGRSQCVASLCFHDYQLEKAGGVGNEAFARHTIIERLFTRREVSFGLSVTLGIGKLPFIHQYTTRNDGAIFDKAFPCQQIDA